MFKKSRNILYNKQSSTGKKCLTVWMVRFYNWPGSAMQARGVNHKMNIELLAAGELDHVALSAYRFGGGAQKEFETGRSECALIGLAGTCALSTSVGDWPSFGGRSDIFDGGFPHVLLLPPGQRFSICSTSDSQFIIARTPSERATPPVLIEPGQMRREERGSGCRLRHVNHLVPKDIDTKFVLFEVFTPGGNWSSYPPHRHDREDAPRESLLEEFYYYQFKPEKGFALHWNFNDDPQLDQAVAARHGTLIPVPKGYHTVAAAPGYDCYYFNAMAGPTNNWNFNVHPDHAHLQDYAARR
jgi:5-deoxy-glucuronate isomerase